MFELSKLKPWMVMVSFLLTRDGSIFKSRKGFCAEIDDVKAPSITNNQLNERITFLIISDVNIDQKIII